MKKRKTKIVLSAAAFKPEELPVVVSACPFPVLTLDVTVYKTGRSERAIMNECKRFERMTAEPGILIRVTIEP